MPIVSMILYVVFIIMLGLAYFDGRTNDMILYATIAIVLYITASDSANNLDMW